MTIESPLSEWFLWAEVHFLIITNSMVPFAKHSFNFQVDRDSALSRASPAHRRSRAASSETVNVSSSAAGSPTIGSAFLLTLEVFWITKNGCKEQVDQAPEPKEKVSYTLGVWYLAACEDHLLLLILIWAIMSKKKERQMPILNPMEVHEGWLQTIKAERRTQVK